MPEALPLAFEIAGFRMSVLHRQFPSATDYWDGNWLVVACVCEAPGAKVKADGPFVHLSEVAQLARKLEALQAGASKSEKIDLIEPELAIKFEAGARGDLGFEVRLTPNHLKQSHRFQFDIDLSYLPAAIQQCKAILVAFQVRDAAAE